MRRMLTAALLALGLISALALVMPRPAAAADQPQQSRTLQGQVLDDREAPVADAIVYLKNTKTLAVKTFIADKDGNYRFNALSPNIDYQVYAESKGKRSDTKTLSSFDSRKIANINLKLK